MEFFVLIFHYNNSYIGACVRSNLYIIYVIIIIPLLLTISVLTNGDIANPVTASRSMKPELSFAQNWLFIIWKENNLTLQWFDSFSSLKKKTPAFFIFKSASDSFRQVLSIIFTLLLRKNEFFFFLKFYLVTD